MNDYPMRTDRPEHCNHCADRCPGGAPNEVAHSITCLHHDIYRGTWADGQCPACVVAAALWRLRDSSPFAADMAGQATIDARRKIALGEVKA
jgi:hypothetical protein